MQLLEKRNFTKNDYKSLEKMFTKCCNNIPHLSENLNSGWTLNCPICKKTITDITLKKLFLRWKNKE